MPSNSKSEIAANAGGKVEGLSAWGVSLKWGLAPSVEIATKVLAVVVSEIGAITRPTRTHQIKDGQQRIDQSLAKHTRLEETALMAAEVAIGGAGVHIVTEKVMEWFQ